MLKMGAEKVGGNNNPFRINKNFFFKKERKK